MAVARSRQLKLNELLPELTCPLCKGFFVDAFTVAECLHSFCKSCIMAYVKKSCSCPTCGSPFNQARLTAALRPDQTLQSVVYKLVPNLYNDEMQRRRHFYHDHEKRDRSLSPERRGEVSTQPMVYTLNEQVSISLEYFRAAECSRRYLLLPAGVGVKQLQKLLLLKHDLRQPVQVDIIFDGEKLSEDLLIMDVACMYNWDRSAPMQFFYRYTTKRPIHAAESETSAAVTSPVTSSAEVASKRARLDQPQSVSPAEGYSVEGDSDKENVENGRRTDNNLPAPVVEPCDATNKSDISMTDETNSGTQLADKAQKLPFSDAHSIHCGDAVKETSLVQNGSYGKDVVLDISDSGVTNGCAVTEVSNGPEPMQTDGDSVVLQGATEAKMDVLISVETGIVRSDGVSNSIVKTPEVDETKNPQTNTTLLNRKSNGTQPGLSPASSSNILYKEKHNLGKEKHSKPKKSVIYGKSNGLSKNIMSPSVTKNTVINSMKSNRPHAVAKAADTGSSKSCAGAGVKSRNSSPPTVASSEGSSSSESRPLRDVYDFDADAEDETAVRLKTSSDILTPGSRAQLTSTSRHVSSSHSGVRTYTISSGKPAHLFTSLTPTSAVTAKPLTTSCSASVTKSVTTVTSAESVSKSNNTGNASAKTSTTSAHPLLAAAVRHPVMSSSKTPPIDSSPKQLMSTTSSSNSVSLQGKPLMTSSANIAVNQIPCSKDKTSVTVPHSINSMPSSNVTNTSSLPPLVTSQAVVTASASMATNVPPYPLAFPTLYPAPAPQQLQTTPGLYNTADLGVTATTPSNQIPNQTSTAQAFTKPKSTVAYSANLTRGTSASTVTVEGKPTPSVTRVGVSASNAAFASMTGIKSGGVTQVLGDTTKQAMPNVIPTATTLSGLVSLPSSSAAATVRTQPPVAVTSESKTTSLPSTNSTTGSTTPVSRRSLAPLPDLRPINAGAIPLMTGQLDRFLQMVSRSAVSQPNGSWRLPADASSLLTRVSAETATTRASSGGKPRAQSRQASNSSSSKGTRGIQKLVTNEITITKLPSKGAARQTSSPKQKPANPNVTLKPANQRNLSQNSYDKIPSAAQPIYPHGTVAHAMAVQSAGAMGTINQTLMSGASVRPSMAHLAMQSHLASGASFSSPTHLLTSRPIASVPGLLNPFIMNGIQSPRLAAPAPYSGGTISAANSRPSADLTSSVTIQKIPSPATASSTSPKPAAAPPPQSRPPNSPKLHAIAENLAMRKLQAQRPAGPPSSTRTTESREQPAAAGLRSPVQKSAVTTPGRPAISGRVHQIPNPSLVHHQSQGRLTVLSVPQSSTSNAGLAPTGCSMTVAGAGSLARMQRLTNSLGSQ